jgi:cytochrome b6
MMVLAMILHVCRVYLTGGFKRPRIYMGNWCNNGSSVTGYSLPWDQVGY